MNQNSADNGRKLLIVTENLSKKYTAGTETVTALKNISFSVPRGEICCIFGTSGSGKSSLLNQLAGLEKPTHGTVRIGGIPVSQLNEDQLAAFRQQHTGFVFQSYNLLPELTALENTALPLLFRGIPRAVRERAAEQALIRVGLGARIRHYPAQMSGGQQQRVGIARAFIAKPEVVFADEPTGNLDSHSTADIMNMICSFAEQYHQTIVIVSHDPGMKQYADRTVTLMDGEIIQDEYTGRNGRTQERGSSGC